MTEPFLFTAATNIQDALEQDPRVLETLGRLGLKCVDRRGDWCVAAAVETLADAALYHNLPLDRILSDLNGLAILGKPAPGPESPAS